MRRVSPFLWVVAVLTAATPALAADAKKTAALTSAEAGPDFAIQGEYSGEIETDDGRIKYGVQVVARGDGHFQAVGYHGGLPGDGWNGEERVEVEGQTENGVTRFPAEHVTGTAENGKFVIRRESGDEIGTLEKVVRKSPTLGKKPPQGAVVLFDGSTAEKFQNGKMTDDGLLIQGVTSHQKFQDFTLHMEFLLPFMPHAQGQARSNSGAYMQGRYEVQILDSFGLEGKNNECGGIYEISDPAVNMCFPPLSWQTYDVDFTAARYNDEGEKVANARMTVRHNGVLVQDHVELPRATRAAPVKEGPEPGPLYLQDHGNPVRFRNIWLVERGSAKAATAGAGSKLPKVFAADFSSGNADRWEPSDPKAWRVVKQGDDFVYNQFQQSKVKTPVRSPFNRSMVKDVTVSDFVFDVKVQSTKEDYPHRDMCLFFGYQDPAHMYYVHLGKRADDHANQIFIVNDAPRLKISTKSTPGTNWDDEWHHVRVRRDVESGRIEVYFDDMNEPVMTAVDKTFIWGQVGVGSFDDTGNFDDVVLYGRKVDKPEYISLFDGKTLNGWHKNPEKIGHGTGGRWRVEDGAIVGEQDPPGSGNGGILLTDEKFGDFELLIDLKPDWGICSGLFLRSNNRGQCLQMMVDYHDNGNVGHIYGEGTGAFNTRPYDVFGIYNGEHNLTGLKTEPVSDPPQNAYTISGEQWVKAWKVGEWNTAKVRVVGNPPVVTTWINGVKVNVFDGRTFEHERYDRERVAELLGPEGRIAVQVHGGKSWPKGAKCRWKNIKIRRLD